MRFAPGSAPSARTGVISFYRQELEKLYGGGSKARSRRKRWWLPPFVCREMPRDEGGDAESAARGQCFRERLGAEIIVFIVTGSTVLSGECSESLFQRFEHRPNQLRLKLLCGFCPAAERRPGCGQARNHRCRCRGSERRRSWQIQRQSRRMRRNRVH